MSRRRSGQAASGTRGSGGTAASPEGLASEGLALHEAAARAQALLRERDRLLREVQKKKLQLERTRLKASREAEQAVSRMAPIVLRHDALIRDLTALFAELLAPGRGSARARNQVAKIRRALELQGVLPPLGAPSDDAGAAAADTPETNEPWDDARPRSKATASQRKGSRPEQPAPEPEVAGAKQVGQGRRSLRELFRSLARAVHPDQARHDDDREHRTAVMKEVTRAYEEGDLARLLELESAWQGAQAVMESGDSLLRCQELERINRELLDQVRLLTREIRDTKREAFESSLGLSADELAEQASQELDELEEIYDFVRDFRDGRVTLTELVRGP